METRARQRGRLTDDILLGLTLALSISYVPLTAATLLAKAELPFGTVVLASTLSIVIGCIASGWLTRTPLVVAPAMGMVGVIQSAAASNEFTGHQALQSCAAGALIVLLLSAGGRPSWRRATLDSIPLEIKLGIQAGVGTVLLMTAESTARDAAKAHPELQKLVWVLFSLATALLVLANVFAERIERRRRDGDVRWGEALRYLALKGAPVYSAVGLALLWHFAKLGPEKSAAEPCTLATGAHLLAAPPTLESAMIGVHIAIVVAFLLLTDLPGTPYLLCRGNADFDQSVERSFKVDSTLAALNGAFGTAPSVYYAENNITRYFRRTGGRPAIVVGLVFAGVALVAMLAGGGGELFAWVPAVAVAPLVAFIGITVVAHSVVRKPENEDPIDHREPPRRYWFYMPTAVMIFVTPLIGLQFSLPVGILVYWLYGLVEKRKARQPAFIVVSVVAGIVVILRFLLWYYEGTGA